VIGEPDITDYLIRLSSIPALVGRQQVGGLNREKTRQRYTRILHNTGRSSFIVQHQQHLDHDINYRMVFLANTSSPC
jgi:hypothetical protein